jgi:hypothetical protein
MKRGGITCTRDVALSPLLISGQQQIHWKLSYFTTKVRAKRSAMLMTTEYVKFP